MSMKELIKKWYSRILECGGFVSKSKAAARVVISETLHSHAALNRHTT
jgi:hypothetical protein